MAKNNYINQWDEKTERIFGFFVGKGLLGVEDVKPLPTIKVDILEALKIGTEIEPRVLEVLPAAMLRFPRSFLNWDKIPEKLSLVLECIKKNKDVGPDLAGLPYKDLKRWANIELPDKRSIPVNERRVRTNWRLKPATLAEIKRRAIEKNIDETEVIERAFSSYLHNSLKK
jgi:hypothetical protein